MTQQDYTDQIMQKIETTKMRPKSYFVALDAGRALLIGVFLCLMIFSLSVFGHDLWRGYRDLGYAPQLWPEFLRTSFIELILFSLLIFGLTMAVYKQTDWPLVRQIWWLLSAAGILVLVFAAVVIFEAENDRNVNGFFDSAEGLFESLPYRLGSRQDVMNRLDQNQVFVGRVTGLRLENGVLIELQIKNMAGTQTFDWDAGNFVPSLNQQIVVKYEWREGRRTVVQYQVSLVGDTSTTTQVQRQVAPVSRPLLSLNLQPV